MVAATSLHPRARRNWFQYSKSSSAGSAGSSATGSSPGCRSKMTATNAAATATSKRRNARACAPRRS
eukprot:scaffold81067_cov60-Phaeocystis_antarctica.AAC.1